MTLTDSLFNMNKSIFTAIIENISTRADKTLKIVIGTNEEAPDAKTRLFEMHQKQVTILISENTITEKESDAIDEVKADLYDKKQKTPSQRLRGVLFRNFQKDSRGHVKFENYYSGELEKIISHYKDKLNP